MSSVFISYSRKDERFARQVATALSNRGFDVWIDVEDIPVGMKWSSAIQQGLDTADAMIVVISPDSMASNNVEDEWQYFLDQKKSVFPVLLRSAKIHFQLSRIQYIDFQSQDFTVAFADLESELLKKGIMPGGPPSSGGLRGMGNLPPKRGLPWWVWAAGALGLLVVILLLVAAAGGGAAVTGTPTLAPSDTLQPSVTSTRTRRPVLSPDQLTATEAAAIAQAETDIALTDLAGTIGPVGTQVAAQTATADALTATADTFTDTPTPNRLQTLVAGRATQTAVANLTATVIAQTPSATPTPACANVPPPRLSVGENGAVVARDLPVRLRSAPSLDANVLVSLPGGTSFVVLDGPLCDQADGVLWWRLGWEAGEGWAVEGQGDTYFLEPIAP
jgi:hypothetical protein